MKNPGMRNFPHPDAEMTDTKIFLIQGVQKELFSKIPLLSGQLLVLAKKLFNKSCCLYMSNFVHGSIYLEIWFAEAMESLKLKS